MTTEKTIQKKINLSVVEAERYGPSKWTWRAWAYSGKIASIKAGSRLLIPVAECERVMREGTRHRGSTEPLEAA